MSCGIVSSSVRGYLAGRKGFDPKHVFATEKPVLLAFDWELIGVMNCRPREIDIQTGKYQMWRS
jgi:hypothetical protein